MKHKKPKVIIQHIGEPISQCPPPDCSSFPSCDDNEKCLYDNRNDRDGVLIEAIHFLQNRENDILKIMSPQLEEYGYISADNGQIMATDCQNKWKAAYIPGLAFAGPTDDHHVAGCTIVNTINDGFHYAAPNPKTFNTDDLGPVVTPVIVGNINKPYGVYIPFNNIAAIEQGADFCLETLSHLYNGSTFKNKSDFPNEQWL